MNFHYEIKNTKLKKLVEIKAGELNISVDELIWRYVNRGLMGDGLNEDVFNEFHSDEYLSSIIKTLGLD